MGDRESENKHLVKTSSADERGHGRIKGSFPVARNGAIHQPDSKFHLLQVAKVVHHGERKLQKAGDMNNLKVRIPKSTDESLSHLGP